MHLNNIMLNERNACEHAFYSKEEEHKGIPNVNFFQEIKVYY